MTGKSAQKPIPVAHLITRMIVGGAQENTLFTAALLNKDRYSVEILTGPQTGSEGSLIEEVRQQNLPVTILPDLVREINPVKDLKAFYQLYKLFHNRNFAILHTHSSKAGILGRLVGRLAGVPTIIHTVHGWSFHDYMPTWLRQAYILLERWAARYTDALVAVTQKDIEKGLAAGIGTTQQYHLIRSAIRLDKFDPTQVNRSAIRHSLGIPQDAVVIGNVGRFSPQKNPNDWLKIAGMIAQEEPGLLFLLVGDGPMQPQVESLLDQEGIRRRTILTGLRRDIPELLSAMDIFLLTSLWEGLPRVVPQAMAMGLPVVAYAVDGIKEIIQHGINGFILQPGEIDKIAGVCQDLIRDVQLRKKIGGEGQASVTDAYNVHTMINQIESLYESILQPVKKPPATPQCQ